MTQNQAMSLEEGDLVKLRIEYTDEELGGYIYAKIKHVDITTDGIVVFYLADIRPDADDIKSVYGWHSAMTDDVIFVPKDQYLQAMLES